ERLRMLVPTARYPREVIISAIALARCLEHEDRTGEAVSVLGEARAKVDAKNEQPLRLCLFREFARLSDVDSQKSSNGVENPAQTALEEYASALEDQLWSMRESRAATLRTRREHERLSRKHGAMAKQALQDPLTGLPNRRALDDRMAVLATAPDNHPLAVALVDLDGFKEVNDKHSHAEGDDVLRVVA